MAFMPWQAKGSLVEHKGVPVGSLLIGQDFQSPGFFQGRPSMTGGFAYNPMASGGSNYAPSNPAQQDSLAKRRSRLCAQQECLESKVPADLLQASASGLDPEISMEAALFQAKRVAKFRELPASVVVDLIHRNTERSLWNLFGQDRVNVLKLNLALIANSR